MNAIETSHLTKYYGKSRGIIDLNLSIKEGDFFGFIGPNGAGKSTTIRTLLGLIHPTEGIAKIYGEDIAAVKYKSLENVGYLPSEAVFYDGMKVSEILKLSAKLRNKHCAEEASKLCERLQLDCSRKIDELSFGNRKKVGIVCALQHNPRLLILDEPTSGLDPLMQREFFSILQERNENGTTIFLSSHILSEIQRNCKRAAIIRQGKLIACDLVGNLSNTGAKRISIHGTFPVEKLEGTRNIENTEGITNFLYSGDINELIRLLANYPVSDINISEPDLEEIFMHYYTEGGEQQ